MRGPWTALRDLYRMVRCTTLAEIGAENARWIRREAAYPNDFADVIEDLNRLGFVVDFVCDGVDNEHMQGRPVVSGFATESVKNWLDDALYFAIPDRFAMEDRGEFGFWVWELYDPNGRHDRARGVVTTRDHDTGWTCRTSDQRGAREIRRDYWYCLRGQGALRSAWQVTIYGPFGTNELWSVLRDACQARLATKTRLGGVK